MGFTWSDPFSNGGDWSFGLGGWLNNNFEDIANVMSGGTLTAAEGISNTAKNAWNDINGVTAAEKAAKQAERNTKAQLAWERERAQNAHQWEVADLEAAGLNKVLTTNGSGAVTSPITPQATDWSGVGSGWSKALGLINPIASAFSSVKQAKTAAAAQKANEQLIANEITLKKAQAANTIAHTSLMPTEKKKLISEIKLNSANSVLSSNKASTEAAETTKRIIEQEIRGKDLKYYEISAIVNHAEKIATLWAGGYITKKIGTKLIAKFARNIAKKSNNLPNYIIRRGKDYINLKTGEILH